MKLKKIASLMLAGIMAVSMLAGCKSGTTDDNKQEDTNNVTAGSQIVTMLNDAIAPNKAGIKFTSDAELDAALKQLVTEKGVKAENNDRVLDKALGEILGVKSVECFDVKAAQLNTDKDGAEIKSVNVYKVSGKTETSLSAAYNVVAKIAAEVNQLKVDGASSNVALKYSYDNAHVSMLETTVDGTNYYYIAVTLNATCKKA